MKGAGAGKASGDPGLCPPRSFFIETLGCQMNVYDSELLRRRFQSYGFRPAPSADRADVILVNACSIRKRAEARAWARLSQYAGLKGDNGHPLVVLCGCVASRVVKGLGEGEVSGVDVVAGCGSYDHLVAILDAQLGVRRGPNGPLVLADSPTATYHEMPAAGEAPLRAFVSISRGCDSHCAYCVVPSARGPHRSRPLRQIIDEVAALATGGTQEVTLLGQNVNIYRDGAAGFCEVLRAVNEIPSIARIRFTSPHPRDMTGEVLRTMAACERVCEHLHLPLQSGSDPVLEAMGRGYTTSDYRGVVDEARRILPGVAISTDLMVGFPGETDDRFEASLRFVEEMAFDAAFTFKYSPRPGTAASRLPGQVPEEVKGARLERLLRVQNRATDASNRRLVGQRADVLVEGLDRRKPSLLTGRTRTNRLVSFEGPDSLVGTLQTVRIESVGRWIAFGRRVEEGAAGGGERP